jgi:hypothetical protein
MVVALLVPTAGAAAPAATATTSHNVSAGTLFSVQLTVSRY